MPATGYHACVPRVASMMYATLIVGIFLIVGILMWVIRTAEDVLVQSETVQTLLQEWKCTRFLANRS